MVNQVINLQLSKKELDLIFKWYEKGFTDIDVDEPLYEKLKQASSDQGE